MLTLTRNTRGTLASLIAVGACLSLASCKDEKPSATNNTSGGSAASSKAGSGAAGVSAAGAFDKPRKADGAVSIEIITNNSSSFWDAMEKGMNKGKQEVSCEAKRVTPPGASPTNIDQKKVFDDAVAANVDGIAVTPIEADAFAPVIDGAIEKGIPVITYDSDSAKSKRLAYLGTNNYEAGKRAGEEAVKLLPNGGKFVAFVGMMSAQNARDRYQGFLDAVKGHKIEPLQDPFQDNADKTGAAYRNVNNAVDKYGNQINLLLGIWSYNGPAIVDVVKQRNLTGKVKVVCFDGDAKTLQNLAAGTVDAAVVQKPYEFGRLATKLLFLTNRKGYTAAISEMKPDLDALGMKVNGNVIDTGVEVVTPATAAPFLKKVKEMGLEST